MEKERGVNMKKVFAEIGFGNGTFLSTEIEAYPTKK